MTEKGKYLGIIVVENGQVVTEVLFKLSGDRATLSDRLDDRLGKLEAAHPSAQIAIGDLKTIGELRANPRVFLDALLGLATGWTVDNVRIIGGDEK